jgi:hypothetical protein
MDAMPISKFKAQCLSVMDRVRRDVVPAGPAVGATRTLGFLKDATTITGDIVAPVTTTRDWNALR